MPALCGIVQEHLCARVSPKVCIKVCLKLWGLDYDSMLHLLGITRISTYQQFLKLVLLYRAVNGPTYFPPGIFVPRSSPTRPVVTLTLILLDSLLVQIMLTVYPQCHYALEQLAQL